MQHIKITIDVDPQKIPELVCRDYSAHPDYGTEQVALSVAKALGLEDFLSQPDRIYELRRRLWEQRELMAASSLKADGMVA